MRTLTEYLSAGLVSDVTLGLTVTRCLFNGLEGVRSFTVYAFSKQTTSKIQSEGLHPYSSAM